MTDQLKHTPEFDDAWDDLRSRLKEPTFNMDTYFRDNESILAPETIKELRIAVGLGKLMKLEAEWEKWKKEDDVKRTRGGKFRLVVRRTSLSVAAVLVLLMATAGFAATARHPISIIQQIPYKNSATISYSIALFTPPVYAEELFQDLVQSSTLRGLWKAVQEIVSTALRIPAPINSVDTSRQVEFNDIDGDGEIEILITRDGWVLCFNSDGTKRWEFRMTDEVFLVKYRQTIEETAKFLISHQDVFGGYKGLRAGDLHGALRLMVRNPQFAGIEDLDNDGEREVLVNMKGIILGLDERGHLDFSFELQGGDFFLDVLAVKDIDIDGDLELICYENSNKPLTDNNHPFLTKNLNISGESINFRLYNGQPFNSRGIYIFDETGVKKWHLNLPFHCSSAVISNWDDDPQPEIFLDTYTPTNLYAIDYSPGPSRNILAEGFDWSSIDKYFGTSPDSILNDAENRIIIIGTDSSGLALVEKMDTLPGDSWQTYFHFREDSGSGTGSIVGVWYSDVQDSEADRSYFCQPFVVKDDSILAVGSKITGSYPEMRFHKGIFAVEQAGELRWVMGLSPTGRVVVTNPNFEILKEFNYDQPPFHVAWKNKDVLLLDSSDLDGDGSSEILAAFGPFHDFMAQPVANPVDSTDIRLITSDMKPYQGDEGLDRLEGGIKGAVMRGAFLDMNNDGLLEIVVVGDEIVITSLLSQ